MHLPSAMNKDKKKRVFRSCPLKLIHIKALCARNSTAQPWHNSTNMALSDNLRPIFINFPFKIHLYLLFIDSKCLFLFFCCFFVFKIFKFKCKHRTKHHHHSSHNSAATTYHQQQQQRYRFLQPALNNKSITASRVRSAAQCNRRTYFLRIAVQQKSHEIYVLRPATMFINKHHKSNEDGFTRH